MPTAKKAGWQFVFLPLKFKEFKKYCIQKMIEQK